MYAIALSILLSGCAIALGDSSSATADVKINTFPSVDIDAENTEHPELKRSK